MAILSSTKRLSSVSINTGCSDIRSRLILRSSSAVTARQLLSNNGLCVMVRYFCSSRVCSTPFQWSHSEDKPKPAILRSALHSRQRAYPSMTRFRLGKPTKVPTTPDTKYDGFSVLIFRVRAETQSSLPRPLPLRKILIQRNSKKKQKKPKCYNPKY